MLSMPFVTLIRKGWFLGERVGLVGLGVLLRDRFNAAVATLGYHRVFVVPFLFLR